MPLFRQRKRLRAIVILLALPLTSACGDDPGNLPGDEGPPFRQSSTPSPLAPDSPSSTSLLPRGGGSVQPISPAEGALAPGPTGAVSGSSIDCAALCRSLIDDVARESEDLGDLLRSIDCGSARISGARGCSSCVRSIADEYVSSLGGLGLAISDEVLQEGIGFYCR
jgi:hypothetical protein